VWVLLYQGEKFYTHGMLYDIFLVRVYREQNSLNVVFPIYTELESNPI